MKFTEYRENKNGVGFVDGYSARKTMKAALKDAANEVKKYSADEAQGILDYLDDYITDLNNNPTRYGDFVTTGYYDADNCWGIEMQPVDGASRYIFLDGDEDNLDDDNIEMEYADANWYICIRFVA